MVIIFYTIPGFVILLALLLGASAMGTLQEYMELLPIGAAISVGFGELVVLYKLKEYIFNDADISEARHPILVGIYWLITFLLNLANSVAIVWSCYLGFQNYSEGMAEQDLFNFTFDMLAVFPIIYLVCSGVLYVNRWLRTSFFDGEFDYLFFSEIREVLFDDPYDSGIIGLFFHTIVLVLINGGALILVAKFFVNL